MHLCVLRAVRDQLGPAVETLSMALLSRSDAFHDHVKLGMTHLQDALPITLGSEFRTWERQVAKAMAALQQQADALAELPQGGTASGSGVNSQLGFAEKVADELGDFVGRPLRPSAPPSHLMASHDHFVGLCGTLNMLATAVLKICNDIRLLTSSLGGRPGIALPSEGLSLPGKRNATVCESMIQVPFGRRLTAPVSRRTVLSRRAGVSA